MSARSGFRRSRKAPLPIKTAEDVARDLAALHEHAQANPILRRHYDVGPGWPKCELCGGDAMPSTMGECLICRRCGKRYPLDYDPPAVAG